MYEFDSSTYVVVSYSISTSNHNFCKPTIRCPAVVSYSISTSNHNLDTDADADGSDMTTVIIIAAAAAACKLDVKLVTRLTAIE